MTRRRWIVVIAASALLLMALISVLLNKSAEPRYEGRTVSDWIQDLRPATIQNARLPPVFLTRAMVTQLQMRALSPRQLATLGIVATPAPAIDEEKHFAAGVAIREIGTNAIPHLLPVIYARDAKLRRFCMKLSQKQKLIKIPWRSVEEDRRRALTALSQLGGQALWTWVEVATNDIANPEVQVYAAHRLSELGRDAMPAVPAMLAMVHHRVPRVWSSVCSAIEKCDSEGILLNLRFLRCAEPDIRASAARSLGVGTHPDMAIPALVRSLGDAAPQVRAEVVLALAKFGTNTLFVTNYIVQAMGDPEPFVRAAATNALNEATGRTKD
jgi:hypothetical protein